MMMGVRSLTNRVLTALADLVLGMPPDYTEFEADGTMQAHGDATCFRDELQSVTGARITSPAGDFQQNTAEASVTAKNSARYPTDYITTNWQINHDWLNGSVVVPHVHWWQITTDLPNWLFAYRWQIQGQQKTTAWTNIPWSGGPFVYVPPTFDQITLFGSITPPVGYGQVSDIIQARLYRDVTNVSGLFAGVEVGLPDVDIINFDAHIEVDMLGSREPYAK